MKTILRGRSNELIIEIDGPVVKEYGSTVIALLMDDDGIANDPIKRLSIAEKILNRALVIGINEEDIIIDPLAMAVSADPVSGKVTLETIRLIKEKLGLNITLGASNVSFGLPDREALNSAFMAAAMMNWLNFPIANPNKFNALVRAADLLPGREDNAIRYLENSQKVSNSK